MAVSCASAGLWTAAALLSVSAEAHHSFATYDTEQRVTRAGTVIALQWMNPHAWLQMQVAGSADSGAQWNFESPSPLQLSAHGWTATSLKPGDKISATFFPMRSGQPGGALLSVIDHDGHTLCARECTTAPVTAGP